MSAITTRAAQYIEPTYPKPTYPNAFDLVSHLPPELSPITVGLLLWIWRHTNSDTNHAHYGKAWKSQSNLAIEMHVSDKTVQRAFDDAEARGLVSREHIFKTKGGNISVSRVPYRKGLSKGRGEYQHSRYWINWDVVRALGVVTESTPKIGVVTKSTPIGVVRESTGVVRESTKVLIEGSSLADRSISAPTGGAIPISGSAAVLESAAPSAVTPELPTPTAAYADPRVSAHPPTSSFRPNDVVVGDEATASSELGRTKMQGKAKATPESEETPEDRSDRLESANRMRQLDMKMTLYEIIKEFKSTFDRLNEQRIDRDAYAATSRIASTEIPIGKPGHWLPNPAFSKPVLDKMPEGVNLKWKSPTDKHRKLAAFYWKQVGSAVALAAWEKFLLRDDHAVPQPIYHQNEDDATGETLRVIGSDEVQQDWLLYIFLKEETNLEQAS